MEVRSVAAIFAALNAADVKYLVVGGLAVVAHGYERLTRDVDLVIQLDPPNIIRGLEALLSISYVPSIPTTPEDFADPVRREKWRVEKHMIVLKLWSDEHKRTPIDIFVYEPFDFDAEYAVAASHEIRPGVYAPVVTYRTLTDMKRAAGRPQDLADLADLSTIQKLKQEIRHD